MTKQEFILKLYNIGAIKFGEFTLKSGSKSPFYFDLRDMISHPDLLDGISELLIKQIEKLDFDYVSGIPYTALPIASIIANKIKKPLLYARKEEKVYGTKNLLIGQYNKGERCLIIDDLITSGESIMETAEKYQKAQLITKDFLVIIDRSNNGEKKLADKGFRLHSLINMDEILDTLFQHQKIDKESVSIIKEYIQNTGKVSATADDKCTNKLTNDLLKIIHEKKSRLVLSLDVDNQKDFFSILDQTAAHIAMLKTHIDILNDFDANFVVKLQAYAKKYNFMIFEDRKFADIGNTVKKQYQQGIYKIKDWSDFITVHAVPGEGILQGLFDGVTNKSSFLLAKMSSKGNLMNDTYTRKVFDMGTKNPTTVSGYIVHANTIEELQRLKNKIPKHQLLLMPGVKLEAGSDAMGQQYTSVAEAIAGGADLIIVGRGIISTEKPNETAKKYKEMSWK